MRLKDKAAVVTGAAAGIGLACARRFAAEAKVVRADIDAETGAAEAYGGFDRANAKAGIVHACNILGLAEEDFDRVIRVNPKGVFLTSDDSSYITGQTIYPDGGRLALDYTVPVAESVRRSECSAVRGNLWEARYAGF